MQAPASSWGKTVPPGSRLAIQSTVSEIIAPRPMNCERWGPLFPSGATSIEYPTFKSSGMRCQHFGDPTPEATSTAGRGSWFTCSRIQPRYATVNSRPGLHTPAAHSAARLSHILSRTPPPNAHWGTTWRLENVVRCKMCSRTALNAMLVASDETTQEV